MYSRCSHCQTLQEVGVEQLRLSRGLLKCSTCGKRFDALASLSEQVDFELHEERSADFLPNLSGKSSASGAWGIGCTLLAIVLVAQTVYFEGGVLSRQPMVRTGLQAICEHLHCRLPEYKNLDEWSVSHSDFRIASNIHYVFSAAITNQAAFMQSCPDLKLVLRNFNGEPLTERIFSSRQYTSVDSLAANETAKINLDLVIPPGVGQIGGYTFTLI